MSKSTFTSVNRGATVPLILALCCFAGQPVQAEVSLVTLPFEAGTLTLATGTVSEESFIADPTSTSDVKIAYNALRSPHAVVVAVGDGAQVAVVTDTGFDAVSTASLTELTFSGGVDIPFDASCTVVVRTGDGSHYKLGNAVESADAVTFNYAPLN